MKRFIFLNSNVKFSFLWFTKFLTLKDNDVIKFAACTNSVEKKFKRVDICGWCVSQFFCILNMHMDKGGDEIHLYTEGVYISEDAHREDEGSHR